MYNKSLRITINQLLLSNVYLGDNVALSNNKMKSYLLGYKNGSHILNFAYTHLQLKLLINILVNLISLRQKILIVKNLDVFNLNIFFNYKNVFFYDNKWIGGLLTNHRIVRKSLKFKKENNLQNSLGTLRYMPSLLFLFNTNISKWALLEANNLEIPISSIVNSSSSFLELINYPVIGNNNSFNSVFLYVNILKNAILKGKQKERLNILRIT